MNKRWWLKNQITDEGLVDLMDLLARHLERNTGLEFKLSVNDMVKKYDKLFSPSLAPDSLRLKRKTLEGGGLEVDSLFAILGQAYKEEQALHNEIRDLKKLLARKQEDLEFLSVSRLSLKSKELAGKELALNRDAKAFNEKVKEKEAVLLAEKTRLYHEAQQFIETSLKKSREEVKDFKWRYEKSEEQTYGKDLIIKDLKRKNHRIEEQLRKCGRVGSHMD